MMTFAFALHFLLGFMLLVFFAEYFSLKKHLGELKKTKNDKRLLLFFSLGDNLGKLSFNILYVYFLVLFCRKFSTGTLVVLSALLFMVFVFFQRSVPTSFRVLKLCEICGDGLVVLALFLTALKVNVFVFVDLCFVVLNVVKFGVFVLKMRWDVDQKNVDWFLGGSKIN